MIVSVLCLSLVVSWAGLAVVIVAFPGYNHLLLPLVIDFQSTTNDTYIWKSILKPTANWSLFKLIISDQRLIKLKLFFAYICEF